MPSGVSNLGPITAPEINNAFIVGSVLYPTIQSAVTAAAAYGSSARVVIPYGASPSDTIAAASGTTSIAITDQRNQLDVQYAWSGSAYVISYPATLTATGAINTTAGTFQVNGTQISSTNLSDGSTIAHLSSNITGTSANVTGTVAIANGGTGAATASAALTALGAVPSAGGTMTGPLVLPSTTPSGYQAVNYTYLQSQLTASGMLPNSTAVGQFLVSTSSSSNSYTARTLVSADIPNNAANTSGTAAGLSATLAIASGGTNATTASAALTNLGALSNAGGAMSGTYTGAPVFSGAVSFSGNPTFSGTSNFTGVSPITYNGSAILGLVTTTSSATPVFNGAGGIVFPYTMAQNVTSSTTTNLIPGQVYVFEIIQAASGTGPFTFVWPTTMINTSPISQVASQRSIQFAVCVTGGQLLCIGAITYV